MMFDKLKELREYEAKTQRETAGFLNVTRATYAGWESGKDIIPLRKLNELANIFEVSMDYLVGTTETYQKREKKIIIHPDIVSENIKKIRVKENLTQRDLAKKLKTTQSNIHKYENGSLITTMYAIELSKSQHYPLEQLIQKK